MEFFTIDRSRRRWFLKSTMVEKGRRSRGQIGERKGVRRKDKWTLQWSWVDSTKKPGHALRLYLIDSGSWLAGGPFASTRSSLLSTSFIFDRWRHENTRALARELPPGGGPFHVGGSRVPGPNTFLIEMFIGGTTSRPRLRIPNRWTRRDLLRATGYSMIKYLAVT